MSDSATPWTAAHQAPLSMRFPRQEYWSGLPFPSPGNLPNPGIKPASPAMAGGLFTTEPPGKPSEILNEVKWYTFFFYYFTILHWFCHTSRRIRHGCTRVPHPESPSLLPPHTIPLGRLSAPALSTLSHALNLDWQSVSHMIIYMFQCYSFKSSHPCLLPESKRLFFTSVSLLLSRI